MKQVKLSLWLLGLCLLMACSSKPKNAITVAGLPPMYPDYTNITLPYNMAPLNFLLRDRYDAMEVSLQVGDDTWTEYGEAKMVFSESKWHEWLARHKGNKIKVQVTARKADKWYRFAAFQWSISTDAVDAYLSYRLIEPGYEVWNHIQLCERNLESFEERVLLDNDQVERSCMNCHIYGGQSGDLSLFHLRGAKGGTILNQEGRLRKLSLKAQGMISACVYGGFHPSGRYGVFSTNEIIPAFHAQGSKRLEVYDTASDVVVVDFSKNEILTDVRLTDSLAFETFPTFSADGKSIYYCSAAKKAVPDSLQQLKYSLCRVAFDAKSGTLGNRIDTLWNARVTGRSVCHPKASPDGRFLMYTVADYGTFPIWHREADLELMDLQRGKTYAMKAANSNRSDTYHSWSSNSRWFVFASKRGDGKYGKAYLAHVGVDGQVTKAFCIPQKDPSHDDETLKSYNIPELSRTPVHMDHRALQRVYEQGGAEAFNIKK